MGLQINEMQISGDKVFYHKKKLKINWRQISDYLKTDVISVP